MTISSGFNYIAKNIIGSINVDKNYIPIILSADTSTTISLPIDTTSITNISDYTFSSVDLNFTRLNSIKRTSSNYNWRYFAKIIYNANMSSSVQIQKNYTAPGSYNLKIYPISNSFNPTNQTVIVNQYTTTT